MNTYKQVTGLICEDCGQLIPNARSKTKKVCDECSSKRHRASVKRYEQRKKLKTAQ